MFSRAGHADFVVLAIAFLHRYAAQLVLFPAAGELAWYFPKYDCFRWAGAWRPRNLIDPFGPLQDISDRPQSRLPI